jgi:hypothetical protein
MSARNAARVFQETPRKSRSVYQWPAKLPFSLTIALGTKQQKIPVDGGGADRYEERTSGPGVHPDPDTLHSSLYGTARVKCSTSAASQPVPRAAKRAKAGG